MSIWTPVQNVGATAASKAFPNDVVAGSLLVASAGVGVSGLTGVTDSQGNTWSHR